MKILLIVLFFLSACSIKDSRVAERDDFDRIIHIMKIKTRAELERSYGRPDEISDSRQDETLKILRYKASRIDAYVKKSEREEISHMTIFFFEDFDNYAYLKKRFQDYEWVESTLPSDPTSHIATDIRLVKVPEIRMEFQYDNLSPKRKVMWIYFE